MHDRGEEKTVKSFHFERSYLIIWPTGWSPLIHFPLRAAMISLPLAKHSVRRNSCSIEFDGAVKSSVSSARASDDGIYVVGETATPHFRWSPHQYRCRVISRASILNTGRRTQKEDIFTEARQKLLKTSP